MDTIRNRILDELRHDNKLIQWNDWKVIENWDETSLFYGSFAILLAVVISTIINLFLKEILTRKRVSFNP